MKILQRWMLVLALAVLGLNASAQVPAPDQLLPDDTIAVLTCPNWRKTTDFFSQSQAGQLWNDPALKPFREKLEKKFGVVVTDTLQQKLSLKLQEYTDLLQGQITIALTPPREGSSDPIGFLILIDAKEKSDALAAKVSEFKKKWSEGREVKTEKIRDVDFTILVLSQKEMKAVANKVLPKGEDDAASDKESKNEKDADQDKDKAESKSQPLEIRLGQSKSLLIIGENPKSIEKVLARQTGGLVPPLSDQAAFQKNHAVMAHDALIYGWLNWKPIYELIAKAAGKASQGDDGAGSPNLKPDKLLPALGLKGIESMGFSLSGNADGATTEFFLAIPEAQREGLFQVFNLQAKDASPPSFVPADAVKFQRWRIDAQKSWAALEATITKIDPNIAAMVQLGMGTAGKDKDPNFDLKKSLIGNLGDDFIFYQKLPKSTKISEISTPPSISLIGSQKPEEISNSIRLLSSLLPAGTPAKEREFLGKKIYTMDSPFPNNEEEESDDDAKGKGDAKAELKHNQPTFSFAASGGYLAMSSDASILEEYLRSSDASGKSLRDTPGLAETAAKGGGMDKGFFGFENQKETLRFTLDILKNDKDAMEKFFSIPMAIKLNPDAEEPGKNLKDWVDYTLLPSFDQISKYFSIITYSGNSSPEGFSFKAYQPMPPQLKK